VQWPGAIFLKACHQSPIDTPTLVTTAVAAIFGLPADHCSPNDDEKGAILGIELLYTMPAPSPWSMPYSIDSLTIPLEPSLGALEDARLRLHHSGLLVLDAGVKSSLATLYTEAMLRIQWAERCLLAGGVDVGKAHFHYLEMSSRQEQRFDLLFAPGTLVVDAFIRTAPWQPLIEHILGGLQFQLICNMSADAVR
jgi:hypothetical protein